MSKYDDFNLDLRTTKSSDLVTTNEFTVPLLTCTIEVSLNVCTYITDPPSCRDYDSCHPDQTVATCPTGNCGGSLNYCQNKI